MFTSELMKRLDFNCELIYIKLSSYNGTQTTGNVREVMGLTRSIEGKRVIVVEDIVDSGNTIVELQNILKKKGAAETSICTMLLKPASYTKDVRLDYVAIEIPHDFIVGFGLDYNEVGRNLKDIYVLDTDMKYFIRSALRVREKAPRPQLWLKSTISATSPQESFYVVRSPGRHRTRPQGQSPHRRRRTRSGRGCGRHDREQVQDCHRSLRLSS